MAVIEVSRGAAGAMARQARLAAVGIENANVEIGAPIIWSTDHSDAISARAVVANADLSREFVQAFGLGKLAGLNDNVIVAVAVKLDELNWHVTSEGLLVFAAPPPDVRKVSDSLRPSGNDLT